MLIERKETVEERTRERKARVMQGSLAGAAAWRRRGWVGRVGVGGEFEVRARKLPCTLMNEREALSLGGYMRQLQELRRLPVQQKRGHGLGTMASWSLALVEVEGKRGGGCGIWLEEIPRGNRRGGWLGMDWGRWIGGWRKRGGVAG